MVQDSPQYASKMFPTQSRYGNINSLKSQTYIHDFNGPNQKPTRDPLLVLKDQIKAAPDPAAAMKITMGALQEHKDDPIMSMKIIGAAHEATVGAGKAETMGKLMESGYAGMVLNLRSDLRDVGGHDLSRVSTAALQALPYNQMNVTHTIMPVGLDLSQNQYMNGANLDGVTARNMVIPSGATLASAREANLSQENATPNAFKLASVGGNTGFQAVSQADVRGTHDINVSHVGNDMAKVSERGGLKNDHTVKPKWAGMIEAPGIGASA